MNIKVGNKYITRNGGSVFIESEHKEEPIYRFFGKYFTESGANERNGFWMENGRYLFHKVSDFDITRPA